MSSVSSGREAAHPKPHIALLNRKRFWAHSSVDLIIGGEAKPYK
jgi:hypothetical protein